MNGSLNIIIWRALQRWAERWDRRRHEKGKPGVEGIWPEYFGDPSRRA